MMRKGEKVRAALPVLINKIDAPGTYALQNIRTPQNNVPVEEPKSSKSRSGDQDLDPIQELDVGGSSKQEGSRPAHTPKVHFTNPFDRGTQYYARIS
jgi:hypothetical protein